MSVHTACDSAEVIAGQMAAEAAFESVDRAFSTVGVDAILLKGPHLSTAYYADATERRYTDLDLLIPVRQLPIATQALREAGFATHETPAGRYLSGFLSPQEWPVELHVAYESFGLFDVDYEAVFERTIEFRFGVTAARGLSSEDLLLHLVMHAAKSHFREIDEKHVNDIRIVVEHSIDWSTYCERARAIGCQTATWIMLEAASKIHGAVVSQPTLEALRPGLLRRNWLRMWLRRNRFPLFRWHWLPIWVGRIVVLPGIVDELKDGIVAGLKFLSAKFKDLVGRQRR